MVRSIKLMLAFLLMSLMANIAIGAPVLKPSIEVSSLIVTVGDMFDNAGINAERALFRSPAPGTKGNVSLSAIKKAAAKVGVLNFEDGGLEQVSVKRQGTIVNPQDIKLAIIDDLTKRGLLNDSTYGEISFNENIVDFYADLSNEPLVLEDLKYYPRTQSFNAYIQISGENKIRNINGTLSILANVPHLIRSLQTGAIISSSDVELRLVSYRFAQGNGFTDLDEIIGKQIRRSTRKGVMISPKDVIEPELIARSSFVTLYYRNGPLTLTIKGQALNSAAKGELVSVLNLTSKNIVQAMAIAPGTVEINATPLEIAKPKG
ncbi:MAG: flagellar basal body P-ring formation chaperone FlgA [Devosiaceae bacterium]|nr:flagellar basal body P-ring formation chaperone FlgA [Devosiaceae bacterium]